MCSYHIGKEIKEQKNMDPICFQVILWKTVELQIIRTCKLDFPFYQINEKVVFHSTFAAKAVNALIRYPLFFAKTFYLSTFLQVFNQLEECRTTCCCKI